MSDILILIYVEFCLLGYLGVVLVECGLDFCVICVDFGEFVGFDVECL